MKYDDYYGTNCFYCGGSGKLPCDWNGGEGTEYEHCPICVDTGEHICPECDGIGKVKIDR